MARRRLPRSLHTNEIRALFAAVERHRDRLILACGLYLGLRVSEITKLEIPDIDWTSGNVLVRAGKGDKDRVVPSPPHLLEQLRSYLKGREVGYVFPSPRGGRLSSRAIQVMLKRVAMAAGLAGANTPRGVHPHRLRHSFATNLLRTGADIIEVRDLMGHASVSTTQVYLAADPSRLKAATARLDTLRLEPEPPADFTSN